MTAVIEPALTLPSWRLTAIGPHDRADVHRLFAACSPTTVEHRFRARLPAFPGRHLEELLAGPPERHDALGVRAEADGELVALGSLAPPYGPNDGRTAELGLLVADAWQRRGLGRAMTAALAERAARRGVRRIVADVEHGRGRLLDALGRRLTPIARTAHRDGLTGVFAIAEETSGPAASRLEP